MIIDFVLSGFINKSDQQNKKLIAEHLGAREVIVEYWFQISMFLCI